ncbi:MAG: hypothetical protein GYB68_19715, partial [Chloroflexi bacterium]|nr:hypothetical protein [Chloroflexota bacterium]
PVPFTITNSLFSNNTADGAARGGDGGALGFAQVTNTVIANSTFTNNRANIACPEINQCPSGRGGAMYFNTDGAADFQIYNSTIASNYAEWFAGAIVGNDGTIRNTIIDSNVSGNRGGEEGFSQCTNSFSGGNNIQWPNEGDACVSGIGFVDPLLSGLNEDGVLLPTAGSPAIDNGDATVCSNSPVNSVDQIGTARPQGIGCDIGAAEVVGEAPTNLISNYSFEDPLDGSSDWTVISFSGSLDDRFAVSGAPDGSHVLLFDGVSGEFDIEGVMQSIAASGSSGDRITLIFDIGGINVAAGGIYGARLTFMELDSVVGQIVRVGDSPDAGSFVDLSVTFSFTAPGDFDGLMLEIGSRGIRDGRWGIDNVRLYQ